VQYSTALARSLKDDGSHVSLCLTVRNVVILVLCLLTRVSIGQTTCDSTTQTGPDFPRIFGGVAETWQTCGDTIVVRNRKIIYSYPNCLLWAETERGKMKWMFDLGSMSACKLMAYRAIGEPRPNEYKSADIVFQVHDKRIFVLQAKRGSITPVRLDHFGTRRK